MSDTLNCNRTTVVRELESIRIKQLRKEMRCDSAIFAKLTPKEYARFQKAHIMFSGSTGDFARPQDYGGLAPYIASYFSQIPKALRALRWKRIAVKQQGKSWIITKHGVRPKELGDE
jgi:hypothetical protein